MISTSDSRFKHQLVTCLLENCYHCWLVTNTLNKNQYRITKLVFLRLRWYAYSSFDF